MPRTTFVSLSRPVKCRLEGNELVFAWARHRRSEGGKLICEVNAPRNWTNRTLSAFLRLRSPQQIPSFVEKFGALGKPNSAESETAVTWLLWVSRAKAILSFNDALGRKVRPTTADEKLLADLFGPGANNMGSAVFHGVKWSRPFFLMLGISAWLNSPIPFGAEGNVVRVGVHRFGGHLTIEHHPTCLLGFLGLQILRRLQGGRRKINPRRCFGCGREFPPGRVTQRYCARCIKGKVRQRNNMRAYRERLLPKS